MSTAPLIRRRLEGGELLTVAARTLELVADLVAACQEGMLAREGEIEFLAQVIAAARGRVARRSVVIDQAGDVRMRLLAHYEQAVRIGAGIRSAAAVVEQWALGGAYVDDEPARELSAAIDACAGSAAAVTSSLAAAADAMAPTAAGLIGQGNLLVQAAPAVGMCRRFTLAAHGALAGLREDLESARRLCRLTSSPALHVVDDGRS